MPYTTRYHLGWDKPTGPTMEEITQELTQRVERGDEDDMSGHSPEYWERLLEGDVIET